MAMRSKKQTKEKPAQGKRNNARKGGSNSKLTKKELDVFRKALLARRQQLSGDLDQMTDEALGKSRQVSNGDVSVMPTHMADLGTDVYEQEFTLGLMENERGELKEMDRALDRMDRGVFGVCEGCGGRIRKMRLKALSHARHCISCQRELEQGKG